MARTARWELVGMGKCRNCGVDMGPEETCVFATFKTNVGGREIMVCCPSCAADLEQAAMEPKPAPAEKKPVKKAPAKAKKPARKAPAKAKKAVRKPGKNAQRKAKNGKAKKPARRPARRRRR